MRQAKRLDSIDISPIRKIMAQALGDAYNLALGELDFALDAQLLSKLTSLEAMPYTPNNGDRMALSAVSAYTGMPAENTVLTCGAQEAFFSLIMAYIEEGDEVLLPDPCFLGYAPLVRIAGGKVRYFSLDKDFAFARSALEEAVTPRTKMLILNNPSNPLSTVMGKEELTYLADFCQKHEILFVCDEVYRELTFDGNFCSAAGITSEVLIVGGLSKSHALTGARIGWLTAHKKELILPPANIHRYNTTCAPYASQQMLIYALSANGLNFAQELKNILRENALFAQEFLSRYGYSFVKPQAGFYLFVAIGRDDEDFCVSLARLGVLCVPGSAFGKKGAGYIRLSLGMSLEKLKLGLKEFVKLAENL